MKRDTVEAITKAGATKAAAWADIEKAAERLRSDESSLTREQAIDRVVQSTEGVALVKAYREALDYDVEHAPPHAEFIVSATADLAARSLDALAEDVARRSRVTKVQAYETVLTTKEGRELLERYRAGMTLGGGNRQSPS